MQYIVQLPPFQDLRRLAEKIDFPATRETIEAAAVEAHSSGAVIRFLELFPARGMFESRDDFLVRSEEVEMLIAQERLMPKEILRSPQD